MVSKVLRKVSAMLLAVAMPWGVQAAETSHPCSNVTDAGARLACYDQAFPPPKAVYEAAARKSIDEFGLERQQPLLRNPGQSQQEADPDRLSSRVTKVEYGPGASRTFTLENDQVWTVAETSSRGNLSKGDSVTVRKALIGGYQLITPAGVSVRVRRIR